MQQADGAGTMQQAMSSGGTDDYDSKGVAKKLST